MNKRKIIAFSAIAAFALIAVLYFFPRPLESAFEAPVGETDVIVIRYDEWEMNESGYWDVIGYELECSAENGLSEKAAEIFTNTKIIQNPINLLPWGIHKRDGFIGAQVLIGRPDDSGEHIYIGEKELFLSKGEFKIFYITNRDLMFEVGEFVKEYGTKRE